MRSSQAVRRRPSVRRGASLVESLVAIVVLSLGCLSLSRVMMDGVRRDREAAGASYQSGLLHAELGRVMVAPPVVGAATTCRVDTNGPLPFSICVLSSGPLSTTRRVTVSVTPTAVNTRLRAESATLELALDAHPFPL